jgi:hypothetical protein
MAIASMVIAISLALMIVIDRTIGSDRFFGSTRPDVIGIPTATAERMTPCAHTDLQSLS